MKKVLSLSLLLLAGLSFGLDEANAGTCTTTSNFTVKFYESGYPYNTVNCLKAGKRYVIGANCTADNHAYLVSILGNGSPQYYKAEDCGGLTGIDISTDPRAGPDLYIDVTPTCTGDYTGANYSYTKRFTYRICGR
jgi:hypothetical protein